MRKLIAKLTKHVEGALGGKVVVWRLTTPEERALFAARKAVEAEKCGAAE